MNILMLNPPFKGRFSREQRSPAITKSGTLYYPMWLAYATGVLEEEGFNVRLIDAPASGMSEERVVTLANEFSPSLIVVDTSTPSIYNDVRIGELLKDARCKRQEARLVVVLVGPHVSATPEETLRLSDKIDIVCRGEYDWTIREIAKKLNPEASSGQNSKLKTCLDEIKGISFRSEVGVVHNEERELVSDLDAFPFVSGVYKRHLDHTQYFYAHSRHPVVTIIGGRGCPHRCIYCVYPQTFSGRKVRYRSVKNVVDELEFIVSEFKPLRELMFEDDTLTLNRARCKEFCNEILSRKLRIRWSANSRADVDFDTLKLMKTAGCRLLCVGFESGDQNILDNMHKGVKLEQMRQFVCDSGRAGILIHGCFMVGNPGETRETMEKTLKFALELNLDTAQFFPIMVYPGTEAYEWAKRAGYITTESYSDWLTQDGLHNCVVSFPELSGRELVEFCDYARREFYLRPQYLFKKTVQVVKNPYEGKRVFKSVRTFAKHLFKEARSEKRETRNEKRR